MQYCPKCEIHITGNKECCPLCQGPVSGEPESSPFPVLKKPRISGVSLFKVSTFFLLVLAISIGGVALVTDELSGWMTVTMIFALLAWADTWIVSYYRNNPLMLITTEFYVLMLLCLGIDMKYTRMTWSVPFVIPTAFLLLIVLTIVIAKAMKMSLEEYVLYLGFDVVFSVMQLIPVLLHRNRHPLPAVISMGLTLVFAAAVLIFRPKQLKNASDKWFRIK